jgi:hypothetical protein
MLVGCGGEGGTVDRPDSGIPPADATFPDGGPRLFGDGEPFSIILVPDTQFYVQSYPMYFESEMRWIVDNKQAHKIAFALHLGDIVETPVLPAEWQRASTFLGMLDGMLPYSLAAGNHDIIQNREAPLMNSTFPLSRFNPHLKGTYQPDKIQNAYYLFPAAGREWLVVSLEFGPRNEVLAWADGIFKMHADKPAILLTHAYMYLGDQRYDITKKATWVQYWSPYDYPLSGSINDGQQMWDKLVSINDNIIFVFSGHATNVGGAVGRISTRRASGAWVHEMLSNFQGCPSDFACEDPKTHVREEGGKGMIRKVLVEPAKRRALVETFSPVIGVDPKTDAANQFELPLE